MDPSPLFDYMRERHQIYLRRQAGLPKSEWTQDPIFQQFRFCNVFRELDRTTIWLRENVRAKVPVAQVLLATVLFRWFNRMTTGDAIFNQQSLGLGGELPGETAWEAFARTGDVGPIRAAILQYCGKGPYVTGSYIIKTPDGKDKLDGVLWCIEQFYKRSSIIDGTDLLDQGELNRYMTYNQNEPLPLEMVWKWLKGFPFLGDFMSYEVVTDLRHTPLLDKAPDIMTWANPGPGAMRGLNRLTGRDLKRRDSKESYIQQMRDLLFLSEDRALWPGEYPSLEMRDIEHSLCEYDKMERVRLGQGVPRQRFR